MKKFLLATGLFLSISLMVSAQEKKATVKATTTVQPTAQTSPINKQEKNKQLVVRQDNTASIERKKAIVKARENGVVASPKHFKSKAAARAKAN